MKTVIRLIVNQPFASYRKPTSILSGETYPLPPYSTVIGMIHVALNYTNYHPMRVSVQGVSSGYYNEFTMGYYFGMQKERTGSITRCASIIVSPTRGKRKVSDLYHSPKREVLVNDINLVIHIEVADDLIEEVYNGLKYPNNFLSLGRHEDLAIIESVEKVELEEKDEAVSKMNQYVPLEYFKSLDINDPCGTNYLLNKVFKIDEKASKRVWTEQIMAKYIAKGQLVESGTAKVLVDDKGYLVFLA